LAKRPSMCWQRTHSVGEATKIAPRINIQNHPRCQTGLDPIVNHVSRTSRQVTNKTTTIREF
jgi:hypothetical protein